MSSRWGGDARTAAAEAAAAFNRTFASRVQEKPEEERAIIAGDDGLNPQIPEHLRAKLKSVVTSILPVAPQQESRPPTPPREGTRFGPDPMYPVVARKARAAALHSRVEQVGRPAPRALSQRGLVTHPLLCTFAVTRRPHGRLLCSATR